MVKTYTIQMDTDTPIGNDRETIGVPNMLSLFHLLSSSDQGVKYNGLNRQRSTETTEITATILTKYHELILSEIKMDCIMASKRIANGENVRTLPTYLHLQKVSGFCSSAIVLSNLFCSF